MVSCGSEPVMREKRDIISLKISKNTAASTGTRFDRQCKSVLCLNYSVAYKLVKLKNAHFLTSNTLMVPLQEKQKISRTM